MGNDHGLFQDMVVLLQEDAPMYLAAIDQHYASGDMSSLKRAAHTLKGLVLNFGAARAVSATIALENLASSGDREAMPPAIAEVHDALRELQTALSDHARTSNVPSSQLSDRPNGMTFPRSN
jgi:HPt (histidine-containing phosphotransfer) domain-containing protein